MRLPNSRSPVTIEAFVATNLPTESVPKAPWPNDATELANWASFPKPRILLIKFPGTAGRAERSSPFPANLITASQNRDVTAEGNAEGIVWTSDPIADSRRAEPAVNNDSHYEVWTWNPPGYGRSSGRASLTTLVPAAKAFAMDVSRSRCGPQTQIWLGGNSLGCLPALSLGTRLDWLPPQLAANRCVLWLRNPPDLANTILRVADRYASRSWMRRVVSHLPDELNAVKTAATCQLPAVFLMSERDRLVPPTIQRSIHEAYAGEHRVVTLTDLDHGGPIDEQHHTEIKSAINWLKKKATSPCSSES